jgi:hypothetical protein
MRYIRYGMATILVAGTASLAWARVPAPAAPASGELMAAYTPAAQQDETKPKEPAARPPKAQQPMEHPRQDKADKNQQKKEMKQDKEMKQNKAQSKEEQKDHKLAEGKKIPDKDLKAHFGQSHKFAVKQVITTTRIVPNQTRFVYSGYSFVFVDPWPMGWGFDDDCYIDYVDGGYYIFDPFHPGIRVALMIAG